MENRKRKIGADGQMGYKKKHKITLSIHTHIHRKTLKLWLKYRRATFIERK